MTLDNKYGVPTVALHTHVFEKVVESVNRVHGMPRAPRAFVPQPVMGKTAAQLRAYIEGKDPISGRAVMQEVIEGLTQPIDDSAVSHEKLAYAETPRLVDADSEENLQQLFLDMNWTDKLPIVLPTEKRVQEMLGHTSHKPEEVVGHMRSTHFRDYWEYTVEKVAVNAVMAAARPDKKCLFDELQRVDPHREQRNVSHIAYERHATCDPGNHPALPRRNRLKVKKNIRRA